MDFRFRGKVGRQIRADASLYNKALIIPNDFPFQFTLPLTVFRHRFYELRLEFPDARQQLIALLQQFFLLQVNCWNAFR